MNLEHPKTGSATAYNSLIEIARDLRWPRSNETDLLWQRINFWAWEETGNPWVVLQATPQARLLELSQDPEFMALVDRVSMVRKAYLEAGPADSREARHGATPRVAYLSMEFGLGEALPLYAGGLGILAGDVLKTSSDLQLPVIGIGLLYQCGYFRQLIDASGWQNESYPYYEPGTLPIEPVLQDGDRVYVTISLPGRTLRLRIWRARVGRTDLYLLDSNDPLNLPVDRGITGQLYGGGPELRLIQELVLGIGGWRVVELLGLNVEICHINEGHAAFATVERARQFMIRSKMSFDEAFWATRAGNIFTTHTPVDAGFDRYPPELLRQYIPESFLTEVGKSPEELLALGRAHTDDPEEYFNVAYLAMRGSLLSFGVSKLHGIVSRHIFAPLFPRWSEDEVPVGHVTNGVHVPSWASPWADELWTKACGRERWRRDPATLNAAIASVDDESLWSLRAKERADLVRYARRRVGRQLRTRGASAEAIAAAEAVLDVDVLTIGFARRFTGYKRLRMLLLDPPRLIALLNHDQRPVQMVVAGKAHPRDDEGKKIIQEWVQFAARGDVRHRVVFLEDYDLALAQEMIQGVDLWINTPIWSMEASGTSGMKVLVNGGLNLSVLDGWWAEGYRPGAGWALASAQSAGPAARDDADARRLYELLEQEVVPEFYQRDSTGIPRAWLARVRSSMSQLTTAYSANRMMSDYLKEAYRPAAHRLRERTSRGSILPRILVDWSSGLRRSWSGVRIGDSSASMDGNAWSFVVPVYLGDIAPDDVRVELYAQALEGEASPAITTLKLGQPIVGATNGFLYEGCVSGARPASDYTARVLPAHPQAQLPGELPLIRWQR